MKLSLSALLIAILSASLTAQTAGLDVKTHNRYTLRNSILVPSSTVTFPNLQLPKRASASDLAPLKWQQTYGPFGATIRDFVQTKNGTIFVCSEGGIYRSRKFGGAWEMVMAPYGISDFIGTIYIHPDGALLAFGSFYAYRSTDEGTTWNPIYLSADVRDVVADASGTLYAASYQGGLLSSHDAGRTWTKFGLSDKQLLSIALTSSGKLLCGSTEKLYIASAPGARWDSVEVGTRTVYTIRQTSDGTIYALSDGALWKSTDDGAHWGATFSNSNNYRMYLDQKNSIYVISSTDAGIHRSVDGGVNWSTMPINDYGMLCMHIISKDTLMIGTFNDVLISTNGGASWSRNDSGLSTLRISAVIEGGNGIVLAAAGSSIFRSSDNGISWQEKYHSAWLPTLLGLDPAGVVYACALGSLMRSHDNGDSWEQVNSNTGDFNCMGVKDKSTFFTGTWYGNIFRTTDGGQTWKQVYLDPQHLSIQSIAADKNGAVYCLTSQSLLKSADNGATWKDVIGGAIGSPLTALACCDNTIFIGTQNNGVYRSMNGGGNWAPTGQLLADEWITSLTTDKSLRVFATNWMGLYGSDTWGTAWSYLGHGAVPAIILHATVTSGGYLFIGTQDNGLFRSTTPLPEGTPLSDEPTIPTRFALGQNYPNPFNPVTTIGFSLAASAPVTLKIYDVLGREVATLESGTIGPGEYRRTWNASGFSSGVYFYRLTAGTYMETKRLILQK